MTTSKKIQEVLEDLDEQIKQKDIQELMEDLADKQFIQKGLQEAQKALHKQIAQIQKADDSKFKVRDQEKNKKSPPKRDDSKLLQLKQEIVEPVQPIEGTLEKLMEIDWMKVMDAEEIKSYWIRYHLLYLDNSFAAVFPASDFEKMIENGKKYPTFLLPLPRGQSHEFIISQFSQTHTIYFTPLRYYRRHGDNASKCLTIGHYDKLKDSRQIVLMRGVYDSKYLDDEEAQFLANQIRLYYIQADPEKLRLLQTFTEKTDEFNKMDLIKQLENLSM